MFNDEGLGAAMGQYAAEKRIEELQRQHITLQNQVIALAKEVSTAFDLIRALAERRK